MTASLNAMPPNPAEPALSVFDQARIHMIDSQLRPNQVRNEQILGAMGRLPREQFVPRTYEGIAYIDEDMRVAEGRYLLEPMVLAKLLEEAEVKPADRALDIGVTTGYSTAVLASIVHSVVATDTDTRLLETADNNLRALGFDNVQLIVGGFAEGVAAYAPYDLILINGCVDRVPDALLAQLNEGGRLVTVIRHYSPAHAAHIGEAVLYRKLRGHISHRALFDANVKPLPGMQIPEGFRF